MRRTYIRVGMWVLFAIIQACGVVIPQFTNFHSNIWPLFAVLLLVPGIALVAVLGFSWGTAFAIPVNAAAWYFAMKSLHRTRADRTT